MHSNLFYRASENMCFRPRIFLDNAATDACDYVRNSVGCSEAVLNFNYLEFIVCKMGVVDSSLLGDMLVTIVCIIVFSLIFSAIIYTTIHVFLVPNIVALTNYFYLSRLELGFTIIATCSYLPDVVYALLAPCENFHKRSSMLITSSAGDLFFSFCIGLINLTIHRSFIVPAKLFLFEMILIIGASLYTFELLMVPRGGHRESYKYNSLDLRYHAMALLLAYVAIYAFHLYLGFRDKKETTEKDAMTSYMEVRLEMEFQRRNAAVLASEEYISMENVKETDAKPLTAFLYIMSPLGRYNGLLKMLLFPFWCFGAFTIPVVLKDAPLKGWSKITTCLGCLISPLYLYLSGFTKHFYVSAFMVAIAVFILVMILTSYKRTPMNYKILAIFGCVICQNILYIVHIEFSNMVFQLTTYFFDWELNMILMVIPPIVNTLIETMIIIALLKQGLFLLSFGVVMGTATAIVFLSIPLMVFKRCYDPSLHIIISDHTESLYIFTQITFIFTLFAIIVTDFYIRFVHGCYVAMLVFVFILFLALCGASVVHPLGTRHSSVPLIDLYDLHEGPLD